MIPLVFTVGLNVLSNNYHYSFKTYGVNPLPFDWINYNVQLNLRKLIRFVSDDKEIGLPQVQLYISESSQNSLLEDIPISTKEWKKGFILDEHNKLKKIKVRHKGDNPFNWMLDKKSWRIKTSKKELFELTRYLDYHVPQYNMLLREYSPSGIAEKMGILSPKTRLVELFINDKSFGIYVESERLNEGFLRRNGIMPVNLYKGEQIFNDRYIGLPNDLFNNASLWTKQAYFNKNSREDDSDLKELLVLIRKAETDKLSYRSLIKKVDLDMWSTFEAWQILTQSYQVDKNHNTRIVLDPWSGLVHPIVQDPQISDDFFDVLTKEGDSNGFSLEGAHTLLLGRHSIFSLLNRNSKYIDKKYDKLFFHTVNSPVLSQESEHIQDLGGSLDISYKRDVGHLARLHLDSRFYKSKSIIDGSQYLYSAGGMKEARNNFVDSLLLFQDYIIGRLNAKPESEWMDVEDGFVIKVDGEIPISDIVVSFEELSPDWIAIDLNQNGIVDSNEAKVFSDGDAGVFTVPVRLYANRIKVSTNSAKHFASIVTAKTGFRFITSDYAKVQSISVNNPFTHELFLVNKKDSDYVLPSEYNTPIFHSDFLDLQKTERVFSGIVNIDDDLQIDQPVKILPGTRIRLAPGASLIFQNRVIAQGTKEEPIHFERSNIDEAWGVVALQGPNTSGSIFNNINISGGSGSELNGIYYTAMFSLHNTSNILIKNSRLSMNTKYDDMFHVVYGDNITLNNVSFTDSIFDAIDIDMSKGIVLKKIKIVNAGNDAIDFMETEALVDQANLYKSGDKGISAGENSNILIYNSLLRGNAVGIASKDGSNVQVLYSDLDSNKVQMSLYKKNWRYNDGGYAQVSHTRILNGVNNFNIDSHSGVVIKDTDIDGKDNHGEISFGKNNLVFNKITHPLYGHATIVKDGRIRGF